MCEERASDVLRVRPVSRCTFQAVHARSRNSSAESDLKHRPPKPGETRVLMVFFVQIEIRKHLPLAIFGANHWVFAGSLTSRFMAEGRSERSGLDAVNTPQGYPGTIPGLSRDYPGTIPGLSRDYPGAQTLFRNI